MEITQTLDVTNRDDWRAWLAANHHIEKEIWLILYKKHTKEPTISYNDAVEEALCFGWIDGIAKAIDGVKRAQRFTPRKANSQWAMSNKIRIKKLIQDGRMTPAGLEKIPESILNNLPD